ncbi:zinc finger MYM-type protein 1-like protein, partial [Tanacetum coccineum]
DVTQENKRSKASTSENFQPQNEPQNQTEKHISEFPKPNTEEVDLNSLERDPGKRKRMFEYPANKKEEVRLAYLNKGPFQIHLKTYPAKGSPKRPRRFQYSWFGIFPNWLEYSPTTNAAYCFVCYLFSDSPNVRNGSDAFIVKGFDNWKKVNDGKNCAFLKHIGCLQHRNAVTFCENLLNQEGHIGNIIEKQSAETIIKNRIRLKASIDIVRWLTFQICSFRGRDETLNSKNRGNFIELLKLLASYNVEVANVVLENAPYNAKYTSGLIQKEILSIIANNVRKHIRKEVGDADAAYTHLKSFEFIFILHLMKEVMGRTDILNQALQKKKQDIDIPDMEAPYKSTRYRPRRQDNHVSFEHFYRVDVFLCILDKQLHELNTRFNDEATGLLTLSSALVPKKGTKTFDISKICHHVEKYYPADFTEQEIYRLRSELEIFDIDMQNNKKLRKASTIAELCVSLVKTEKRETYYLFDRLIRLILTLPVSTATTERAFSAMKVCKNRLRNKMSDDFLGDSLVVYIEKEIAEKIDSQSVIEEFKSLKGRRAEL